MDIDINMIIEYLKKTKINPNLINYMQKKYIGLSEIKQVIEESFKKTSGLSKDEADEKIINQLMNGNENFCITSDGNLWLKNETKPQETQRQDTKRIGGQMFGIPNFGQDNTIVSTTDYMYIESKDNQIRERKISTNKHNNAGEQYYSGKIAENIYSWEMERLYEKSAEWKNNEDESIPNEELFTSRKTFSNFIGHSSVLKVESSMENFNEWNFLMEKPTTIVEKNFQENIMEETVKRRISIDRVKGLFTRFINRGKEDKIQ